MKISVEEMWARWFANPKIQCIDARGDRFCFILRGNLLEIKTSMLLVGADLRKESLLKEIMEGKAYFVLVDDDGDDCPFCFV